MNDTLIFLVLAGIALLFRWLTKVGGQSDESDSGPPAPPARLNETEAERIRRFLEALGAPPGSAPPPRVQPRPPQRRVVMPKAAAEPRPAKRSWVQPLPPLVTAPQEPPPLPPVEAIRPTSPVPLSLVVPVSPAAAVMPVKSSRAQPASRPSSSRGSLGALLRSPASVRQAIVLREVLGPPRGLQPFAAGL